MKKIAIFVEGFTEKIFTIRLLQSLAGRRQITFVFMRQENGLIKHDPGSIENVLTGMIDSHMIDGTKKSDELIELSTANPDEQCGQDDIYVLIINCGTDSQVVSQIKRKQKSLHAAGYSKIIGLKDLHPASLMDEASLNTDIQNIINSAEIETSFVFAVLETESWFLEEVNHFEKIDPQMTLPAILEKGFDLVNKRGYEWESPAKTLHQIYSEWKYAYRKNRRSINRTVGVLDWDEMYVNVSSKSPSLRRLIDYFENALFE